MSEFRFNLDSSKWGLLRSVLNEVLNGFALDNFDAVIGLNRGELHTLLSHLCYLSVNEKVNLDLRQTGAFRNALRESLRELGTEEFHTRTGYTFDEGQRVLGELGALSHD